MVSARRAYLTVVSAADAPSWTDRELVEALLARDPRAPVQVWRKYAPRVFGVVGRTLGLAGDADDITQDVFLSVFSRVHTLREPDAFGSFVLSVALRVIKRQLRSRRVRQVLHLVERVPDLPVPELDIEARRTLRRFYEILDTLPINERVAFSLRHLEGMTLVEVAQHSAVSLATAKRRLSKAGSRITKKIAADPALSHYCRRMVRDVE